MYYANVIPYFSSIGKWTIDKKQDMIIKQEIDETYVNDHLSVLINLPNPDFFYVDGDILTSGNFGRINHKPTFADYCHGLILIKDKQFIPGEFKPIFVNELFSKHLSHEDFFEKHRSYLSYPEKRRMNTVRFYHNLYEIRKGSRYRQI